MAKKAGFDEFGNPEGTAFDYGGVDDDRLSGEKILFYVGYVGETVEGHHAQNAVASRKLQMDLQKAKGGQNVCLLDERTLANYTQLWFLSAEHPTLTAKQVKMIQEYVKSGHGLLIWGDNEPYYADANLLAEALIGTRFSGNKHADKIMTIDKKLSNGHFMSHDLTQGVNHLYEGITISTVAPAQDLTILARSHDGQNAMAAFERGDQRIVLDTGFTKLMYGAFHKTAGTARYFRNIAFWLARGARGLQYTTFTPGTESIATIQPGGVSERYKFTVTKAITLGYVLHWEAQGTLKLTIQDPHGTIIFDQSSNVPIRCEITANLQGDYVCWVTAVSVSRRDFPYVLTLVTRKDGQVVSPPPVTVSVPPKPSSASASTGKHLMIYLLIDGSWSAGDYLPLLEGGVRYLAAKFAAGQWTGVAPRLGIVFVQEGNRDLLVTYDPSQVSLPQMSAGGTSAWQHALSTLTDGIQNNTSGVKPLVAAFLAAAPDSGSLGQVAALHNIAATGKCNLFAVGLGGFTDSSALRRLSPLPPLNAPRLTNATTREIFDWFYAIADVMLSGAAAGASGQKSVPPPPSALQVLI